MKTSTRLGALFAGAALAALAGPAPAQDMGMQDMGMHMPSNTLFVAQLNGGEVVGGSVSQATGTGAFLLDHARHTMSYRLTYQGLESGPAKSIAIHNFGRGRNGPVFAVLCGAGAKPCPDGNAATVSGTAGDGRTFSNATIMEFDTARMYVEIAGASGKPEIRGQLTPNSAMASYQNYVADLAPSGGGNASGTAVLTEVEIGPDKTSVFYTATVANASGPPLRASLIGVPANSRDREFKTELALPGLRLMGEKSRATGGTLTGSYDVGAAAGGPLAARLLSAGNQKVGIVVTTSRNPKGELFGAFEQVR